MLFRQLLTLQARTQVADIELHLYLFRSHFIKWELWRFIREGRLVGGLDWVVYKDDSDATGCILILCLAPVLLYSCSYTFNRCYAYAERMIAFFCDRDYYFLFKVKPKQLSLLSATFPLPSENQPLLHLNFQQTDLWLLY